MEIDSLGHSSLSVVGTVSQQKGIFIKLKVALPQPEAGLEHLYTHNNNLRWFFSVYINKDEVMLNVPKFHSGDKIFFFQERKILQLPL